jgi:protein TonB
MSLKVRKSVQADLENKRPLFLILGLALALSLAYLSIEWRFAERSLIDFELSDNYFPDEEDWVIPITAERKPELPQVKSSVKTNPDVLQVIENTAVLPTLNPELFAGFVDDGYEEIIDPLPIDIPVFHFTAVESKPVFKGCEKLVIEEDRFDCFQENLLHFVAKNFQIDDQMMMFSSGEKVYVEFVIEKDGRVESARILRGEDELIGKEAIRLVKSLPPFIPAKINGKPVRMSYMLPINVKLQ